MSLPESQFMLVFFSCLLYNRFDSNVGYLCDNWLLRYSGSEKKMDSTQIEKRLNTYVPDLNITFEDLQKQLTAFIQSERSQLRTLILEGESGFGACGIHTQVNTFAHSRDIRMG